MESGGGEVADSATEKFAEKTAEERSPLGSGSLEDD